MTFKSIFSEYKNVFIRVGHYAADGSLCLMLANDEDGPIANITVCLDDKALDENEAYVDTNNVPEAPEFIEKYGLGRPEHTVRSSGYCIYPLYRFDMDAVEKYTRE